MPRLLPLQVRQLRLPLFVCALIAVNYHRATLLLSAAKPLYSIFLPDFQTPHFAKLPAPSNHLSNLLRKHVDT